MPDQRQYAGYSIKELPKVNTDDEGKVLAVVKGKWDKSGSQIELPVVSSDDNGKVLGVTEGAWNKMDAPTELPAVTNEDNGRILQVSNGSWTKQNMPTELPAVTAGDNGKVLGVVEGNWGLTGVPDANSFLITATGTDPQSGQITTNATKDQLISAIKNNQSIYLLFSDIGAPYKFYKLSFADTPANSFNNFKKFSSDLNFIYTKYDDGKILVDIVILDKSSLNIKNNYAYYITPDEEKFIIDVTGKRGGDNLSVEQGPFLEAINAGKAIYVKDDNASCGLVPLRSSGAGSRTNQMQYAFISDQYVPSDEFENGVYTPKFMCYILDIRDTTAEPFTYVQLALVNEYSTL